MYDKINELSFRANILQPVARLQGLIEKSIQVKASILKNIFYAVMLGVGMAACLSQGDSKKEPGSPPGALADVGATEVETPPPAPDPALFVIDKGRVGNVKIGMPIDTMRQHVPAGLTIADTTLMQEGTAATAYLLRPYDQPKGIVIEQLCQPACHVWRIKIVSPAYQTKQGIGIGATFEQVQQVYPIRNVSLGEGNLVAIADAGLSFVLDKSKLPQNKLASLTPADIPPNTPVKSILVY
jgi:hypothetical protein